MALGCQLSLFKARGLARAALIRVASGVLLVPCAFIDWRELGRRRDLGSLFGCDAGR